MAGSRRQISGGASSKNHFYEVTFLNHADRIGPAQANSARLRLSKVLVALYKGVLYRGDSEDVWDDLLELRSSAQDHFAAVGLSLFIDEADGFAYIRYSQNEADMESSGIEIPRLVARRPLTYQTSLLLALLRKRLAEFEAGGEGTRLIMTRDEIVEMVGIFLPEGTNEAKIIDAMEKNINRVRDMGFIRLLKGQANVYEVMGIIKAFIDAEWLGAFDERLQEYRKLSSSGTITVDD